MSTITIRKFDPDKDSGIIFSTWPKGFYYGGLKIDIKQTKKQWFGDYYEYIKKKLINANIPIACMSNDPSTILGYAVIDGDTLEWVYVKEVFRNQGIANLLTANQGIEFVNNMTKIGKSIAEARGLKEKQDGTTEDR